MRTLVAFHARRRLARGLILAAILTSAAGCDVFIIARFKVVSTEGAPIEGALASRPSNTGGEIAGLTDERGCVALFGSYWFQAPVVVSKDGFRRAKARAPKSVAACFVVRLAPDGGSSRSRAEPVALEDCPCGPNEGSGPGPGFAGSYGRSYGGLAHVSIDVNGGGTFTFVDRTDLGTALTQGTWESLAPGVLRATSFGVPPVPGLVGERMQKETATVTVLDDDDRPVEGARVWVSCDDAGGEEDALTTGEDGTVSYATCVPSSVRVGAPGIPQVEFDNRETRWNRLTFRPPRDEFRLDGELWLFHDGKLWRLGTEPLEREPNGR